MIVAPSGAGKSSLVQSLLQADTSLKLSLSTTTRQPRSGEVDGVPMQNVIARLSATPGAVRFAARGLGADTADVIAELDG